MAINGFNLNANYFGCNSSFVNTLFSSNVRSDSTGFSGLTSLLGEYGSIQSGSYGKLLKEYYKKDDSGSSSSNSITDKLDTVQNQKYGASAEIKEDAKELSASAALLTTQGKDSVFQKYKAETSDKEIISSASRSGKSYSSQNSMEVLVKQTAEAQTNTGNSMKSKELSAIGDGTYNFEIKHGNKRQSVSVKVSASDTNETVLKKTAAAINKADIGVSAAVVTKDGNSYLEVSGTETGAALGKASNSFSFTDKYGSTFTDKLGLNKVTQEAQNAVYSVNGGADKESVSNQVKLDENTTAVLEKASEEAVTLTFSQDRDAINSAIKSFAEDYNEMISTLKNKAFGDTKYASLYKQFSNVADINKNALKNIGITVESDGSLSINETKLNNASSSSVEKLFQGKNSFASRVSTVASEVASSAAKYATQTYSNYSKVSQGYNSSYIGGLYNNFF